MRERGVLLYVDEVYSCVQDRLQPLGWGAGNPGTVEQEIV